MRPFRPPVPLPILLLGTLLLAGPASATDGTAAGTATASAPSSTWIAYEVPFTGDADRDGWTVIELGLAPGGPFDLGTRKLPGPPEWRADSFGGLTPDTDYYLRVTFVDPDGVSGANPQIVGPVHTLAAAANAVTLGAVTVEARETEIHVSVPIADDANRNSFGTVEVATDPGGPWTERCGDPSQSRLPFHPKRCRLRALVPATDYWVRIAIVDPDGVSGTNLQVLGPVTYTGRPNLAAGRPITADPGWGCCPNPAQLLDGRIQYRSWNYGFAWTGGTSGWGGGPPGWKQATIDLGAPTTFDRVEMWLHDNNSPPVDWRIETSDDGASWSEAWSTTDPQCRGAAEPLQGTSWGYPACSQVALFAPVTARYVRYWFDDRTLFGGLHGWAVELEVFGPPTPDVWPPSDPTAVASTTHTPGAWSALPEITVEWSGATDIGSGGLAGYSVLFDTSPSTLPDDTVEVAHTADPHSTTSSALADGQEHYFHLRTCDGAGNCTATVHLGPFWIDATAPIDPGDLSSTSHTAGAASSLNVLAMSWTPGTDALSGVDGYAWEVSDNAKPECDEGKDLEETATGVASGFLADGGWWFHLCTVDHAGNWTSTVTAGPYTIDVAPPLDPTSLASTSHDPGVWASGEEIALEWSGASDAGSGLAGYSVLFNTSDPSAPPAFDLKWGSGGTGPGQFTQPAGIAVDRSGNVYVADFMGNRIQKFDPDGVYLDEWGGTGAGDGEFQHPADVAVDTAGHVYVADTSNDRIQKFDGDGNFLGKWGTGHSGGDGEFRYPVGIATDAAGEVYVADRDNHRIQVFDGDGTFLRKWGVNGTGDGEFQRPAGIAIDASGLVYVVDRENHRVQKFDSAGTFLGKWGGYGTGDGQFDDPTFLAVDAGRNVYVADTANYRIQKFDSEGLFLLQWGSSGAGDGELGRPNGVAAVPSGRVYVAEQTNQRVQRFADPTQPDTAVDVAHTADPHGATSAGLADGQDHYAHLRTCDHAGNCTATVHLGPFWIDATAPVDPAEVQSPSHTPGTWSNVPQIGVEWSGATDGAGAGMAGYSVLFDLSPATLPDPTIDVAHTADPHRITSLPLADGPSHWFHLRSCDAVGNCTATVHFGPFWIDTMPPEVILVRTVADTGDGVLSEGEVSQAPITQFLVTFDEDVLGAGDTANYLLLRDGGDGFQTASCATGADPGDEVMAIDTAAYSSGIRTATLGVHGGTPLFDGAYRLSVCGTTSVTDPAGSRLDGNGDGAPGDDFERHFTLSDTRPTAHPGPDREIDVHEAIVLGDLPSATGGTAPYTYQWTVTPDEHVTLDSATDANPTFSASVPDVCTAELVVTDASRLESQPVSAEITVVCPSLLELFNTDLQESRVYESTGAITAERTRIVAGVEVTFQAATEVVLLDRFTVESGAIFSIAIDPTTDCF